jgi:hypothetical protein
MNEEKRKLIETLNIQISDSDWNMAEKLFCAALLQEGIDITARVLKEYTRMRDLLRNI